MSQISSTRLILGSAFFTGLFLACGSNDSQTPQSSGGTGAISATGGTMSAAAGKGGTVGSQAGAGTGGSGTGGAAPSAGSSATGGHGATGGSAGASHMTGGSGGVAPTTGGSAGVATTGGSAGAAVTGGSAGMAGSSGSAGSGAMGSCNFTVTSQTADKAGSNGIPTVGIVNWSVDLQNLTSASIDFTLMGATTNQTAPVDLKTGPNFRTLLLGMKGSKTYSFKINVSNGATSCTSQDYMITTGAVPSAVGRISRTTGPSAAMQDKGFIVTSTGLAGGGGGFGGGTGGGTSYAYIIDADGDIVWFAPAPATCSRAKMSYDGQYMWMVELNVDNMTKDGGELRRITMDGLTSTGSIKGMANCHHDLTVLPDGRAACMSWIQQSGDQPSDLLETDFQGNVTKIVTVDSSIYLGGQGLGGGTGTFHANSIHYHQKDDSYTVGDRNPNLFVKLSHAGKVLWQFGGSCTSAPAAPNCVAGSWKVNHGHDMSDDGTFLFFNNGQSGASTAFFYKLTETGTFSASMTGSYSPGTTSSVLGDVQRLPNGNTLVTFSTASVIHEIDPSNNVVQQISGPGGYAEWRETLYGAPPRF